MANKRLLGTTPEADRVERRGRPDDAGSVDGNLWDEAAETLARADTVNSISPLLKSGVTGAI